MIRRLISTFVFVVGAMSVWSFVTPEDKPTFIIFTGSDWCSNCRYLEKTVLKDSAFIQFVHENTAFIIADFPQQNKQPSEIIVRNDSLAYLYNRDGVFPKLVLLKSGQTLLIPYRRQRAPELINTLRELLSK